MKPKKKEKLIKLYLTEKQVKRIKNDVNMTYSIQRGFSSDTKKSLQIFCWTSLKNKRRK